MNRLTLSILGALALAGAACDGSGSSIDTLSSGNGATESSDPIAPGVFNTSNNPGPGGTTPTAASGSSSGSTGSGSASGSSSGSTATGGAADAGNPNIDDRVVNYGEALRTASIKLIGVFPLLSDIQAIEAAATPADAQALYLSKITAMLADPRFADTQIQWWRNTFKTGEPTSATELATLPKGSPSFDTAATFAASVVVAGQPFSNILTASTGTCPTYVPGSGTFTPAECNNNAPTSGVLTDPGIQAQFFSHMAMRRTRFIQEIFACSAFPAEISSTPVAMGSGEYTSPWPFDSITGGAAAPIDFQSTSAIICANCHTSINHIAPLFSYFDANGQYVAGKIQVQTPVTPPVTSQLSDWLPAGGQTFAWRYGTTVTDIPSLGQAMAADPAVARCAVTRVWNWAFSRGDVVNDGAPVPTTVSDSYLAAFQANNLNMKALIQSVFTSDDFVKF
jgi:hypothetical protein